MLVKVYHAFCIENHLTVKPSISNALVAMLKTRSTVLDLAANSIVDLKHGQRIDDIDALALSKCLLNIQEVTALDLSYNNITDEGAEHLAELLQGENSLRSLDLTFNNIGRYGAQLLSQSLESNKTLLSLTLSGNKVNSEGALSLANLLQVNNTLQVLRLNNCDLDAKSVIAFAIALKTNQTLRSLSISRPLLQGIQEEWAVHFALMLAGNQTLLELHLGTMGIMTTEIEKVSKGLLFNYNLKYLNLSCNKVTRDDVQPLVDALIKKDSVLEMLDLSSNQLKDDGAVLLSQALASPNCSLKELSVCSNSIGSEGLLSLAKVLDLNSTLTHIYIWGNHFEEPVCLAYRDLIENGRLHSDRTDVRPFEVDGHMFVARVGNSLRKTFYEPNVDTGTDSEQTRNRVTPEGVRFFV
ncbi:hypothetical protein WMY93_031188 [Mugilogobius chulae]|uniref:Leucine rich repeat containing 34 n=1 Tax=Mugilogobius chulae TaxID=88201 RepID=A0AAW0MIN6_9GOBI